MLTKATLVRYDDRVEIDQITLELPNGHKATMPFNPDKLRKADD